MKKRVVCLLLALCLTAGLLPANAVPVRAAETPSFQMSLGESRNTFWYYGGDLSGTIGRSGARNTWGGVGRGNFNCSVSGGGDSYTLTVAEREKYKKSNIIYQPFTLSMEVPAYTSKVLDLDLAMEAQRNSKGAASYYLELFLWGGKEEAAATLFNVGETRNPTPGAAVLTTGYRYFSDNKSGGLTTGRFSLTFTNTTDSTRTITYNLGAYVGMNSSTSLLSSYHHMLNATFRFTARGGDLVHVRGGGERRAVQQPERRRPGV